ncbi:hypothetical protein TUM20983_16650 [Mycobacterium antarcticum]|uniref:hypothetical protein n=1 Tax=Mycolicibacterium sp. TUM20983 TaxID=3023369 RepID=UPI0023A19000|nr:hypothetical protein [Mycolicibacterium sp. TUM20983]GLP74555.1 hypothetical protein TUM20983_16650 [Mycolicibacterium sp. TUM20983]
MSSPNTPSDPLFRAIEYLRTAPEPGWDAIADRVISVVRQTARPGGQMLLAETPPGRPGLGRIFISDHVLRSTLAIVLRQRFLCAPTRIVFDIDTQSDTLLGVLIEITGSYGTPLNELAGHIRATTIEVIAELLGHSPADRRPIDITITDVVTGDPLDE